MAISLSLVTPTLIFPNIPPLEVISLVTFSVPPIVVFPVILVAPLIPTPPAIINAPVVALVEAVVENNLVSPHTFNFLPIAAPPLTWKAPSNVPVEQVIFAGLDSAVL